MTERRLEEFRGLAREHHARIEPDAQFAVRVLARLPREAAWSIDWAARRVLPVSMAVALGLLIVVVATGRIAGTTMTSASMTTSSHGNGDVLEWLLAGPEEHR